MTDKPDFLVHDHGSIVGFLARSQSAQEFAKEAFADATTFGKDNYIVEHRFAQPIIDDLIEQGFTLEGV